MSKTCAQHVGGFGISWLQSTTYPQRAKNNILNVSKTAGCTHFCTQLLRTFLHSLEAKFTSVNIFFSPLSTLPTITTTNSLNRYK